MVAPAMMLLSWGWVIKQAKASSTNGREGGAAKAFRWSNTSKFSGVRMVKARCIWTANQVPAPGGWPRRYFPVRNPLINGN